MCLWVPDGRGRNYMAELFGLDCILPNCFHDTARGYRLRFRVRRNKRCIVCNGEGSSLPDVKDPTGKVYRNRLCCPRCVDARKRPLAWRNDFQMERRDMMFRVTELIVAQSQMKMLGCQRELEPNTQHLIEDHHTLPKGYDARLMTLTEEPMPRCAVYFRWNPEAGEKLTPDLVFQGRFPPNATAVERKQAPEVELSVNQFLELTQYCTHSTGDLNTELVDSYTSLLCQHCARPLPARTFSSQSLRQVEYGD